MSAPPPASPRILPTAVFQLAVRPERLPADLRLRSLEWGILFAATGRHTVAQIGHHFGLTPEERDRAFAHLVRLGLLVERSLTAGEYLRAAATVGDDEPKLLAQFLRGAPARPAAPGVAAPKPMKAFEPLPLPPEEPVMAVTPTERGPLVPPAAANMASRQLSLRALMGYIIRETGETDAGQLNVYRAFLRVDPQLLRRNGITTLRFEDDRVVSDPDLQRAILGSVEQTLGRRCPPEVFVDAPRS
jgi:hypothetical protein